MSLAPQIWRPSGSLRGLATRRFLSQGFTAREAAPQSVSARWDNSDDQPAPPKPGPMWRSERRDPFDEQGNSIVFSGNGNPELARKVTEHLGTRLGDLKCKRFADGEVSLRFEESLRGKDIYLIQPTSPPVNENLMELLMMISTCRRASARKITAVIPYYGYARQDRKITSRTPISAADVARMIVSMGVDRVIFVDLHSGQIQGFFPPQVPVDNLEALVVGLDYFKDKKLENPVVVSPDAGGVHRARKFQEGLVRRGHTETSLAMIIKQRRRANEVAVMDFVGSVEGCDAIIVDDMIDTAGTLAEAAKELRKFGAKKLYAFATHGLFSGPALQRLEDSPLDEVVVTDSIVQKDAIKSCPKITSRSVAVLLADVIRRISRRESLEDLFEKDKAQ